MAQRAAAEKRGGTVRVRISPGGSSVFERLAIVYADPLRLEIVRELFQREMSPSQFREKFGGGSLSRVDRHFKRLADHDWLRLVRVATGGRRRGATEHFYRAPEPVFFPNDVWSKLPTSVKAAYSCRNFEEFQERVLEALEAGTFDARPERHFTWTPLVLDQVGRSKVLAAVDNVFELLSEEQADATIRLGRSEDRPIRATVGLGAFESPKHKRNRSGLLLPPAAAPANLPAAPFNVRLTRVFANPLNLKIVTELNLREMSASQFVEEVGGAALPEVYRRFKMLAAEGWLTAVNRKTGGRRRGATEHFFRATGPVIFDTESWSTVSNEVKSTFSWRVFEQLAEQVREAMDAGTFDAHPDLHQSWTPLILDQLGWEQVIAAVDSVFHFVLREQDAAKARLQRTQEQPVIATVHLAAFESPTPH